MSPPSPSSSSPIRHWLRRSPLGSGSFGRVSLAINLDDGLLFAVKSTPALSPPSLELLAIESELFFLQSLSSPRILACLGSDFSSLSGLPSRNLFLEYMEGGSVAELVKKNGGRLDEDLLRCITRGIVEGLAYLHEQDIVHCDIKGQNVLVGSRGVKIADFGAAKRMGSEVDQDKKKQPAMSLRGTPLWMAPEVLQGIEQGFASDIWSLGCTVVEMVQGRPPWSGMASSVESLLFKIASSQENPPLPESLSDDAADFLGKCLQRDPGLRWTAAQLLQHPFLAGSHELELSYEHPQPSPRSTLDFLSDSDVDEQDDRVTEASAPPTTASVAVPSPASSQPPSLSLSQKRAWITVRSSEGCSTQAAQFRPFMEDSSAVVVKTGCEVNLDCLAFLLQRRMAGLALR